MLSKKKRILGFWIFSIKMGLSCNVKNPKYNVFLLLFFLIIVFRKQYISMLFPYVWVKFVVIWATLTVKIKFSCKFRFPPIANMVVSHWFTKVRWNAQKFTLKIFFFHKCVLHIMIHHCTKEHLNPKYNFFIYFFYYWFLENNILVCSSSMCGWNLWSYEQLLLSKLNFHVNLGFPPLQIWLFPIDLQKCGGTPKTSL